MATRVRLAWMSGSGGTEQQLKVSVPSCHVPGQRSPGLTTKPPSSAQVFTLYLSPGGDVLTGSGVEVIAAGAMVLRVIA